MYTATEKRPDFKLIRKRFLPKCVCLRGSAPDPAGGLTAPPAGKGWVEGQSRIFIKCPAVPRNQQMSRIFRKWYYYFVRCRLDPILHVCLATQQSDELRIKIGKDLTPSFLSPPSLPPPLSSSSLQCNRQAK